MTPLSPTNQLTTTTPFEHPQSRPLKRFIAKLWFCSQVQQLHKEWPHSLRAHECDDLDNENTAGTKFTCFYTLSSEKKAKVRSSTGNHHAGLVQLDNSCIYLFIYCSRINVHTHYHPTTHQHLCSCRALFLSFFLLLPQECRTNKPTNALTTIAHWPWLCLNPSVLNKSLFYFRFPAFDGSSSSLPSRATTH